MLPILLLDLVWQLDCLPTDQLFQCHALLLTRSAHIGAVEAACPTGKIIDHVRLILDLSVKIRESFGMNATHLQKRVPLLLNLLDLVELVERVTIFFLTKLVKSTHSDVFEVGVLRSLVPKIEDIFDLSLLFLDITFCCVHGSASSEVRSGISLLRTELHQARDLV